MDHQQIKELLALAALDRLDPEESRVLSEHLAAGCDDCEAELRELREAAAAIPLGLSGAGLEGNIWRRLAARLDASGAASTRAATLPTDAGRRRPTGRVGWWQAAAGVMAAAAVALAVYAGLLNSQTGHAIAIRQRMIVALESQVGNLREELVHSREQVENLQLLLVDRTRLEDVLLAPDVTLTRLEPLPAAPAAHAVVAVSAANHTAMIQAAGLPATPPGKTYELWWITKERGPIPAGLFQVANGQSVVARAAPPPTRQHVLLSAVTLEPGGGVSKPTGAMYLKGTVS